MSYFILDARIMPQWAKRPMRLIAPEGRYWPGHSGVNGAIATQREIPQAISETRLSTPIPETELLQPELTLPVDVTHSTTEQPIACQTDMPPAPEAQHSAPMHQIANLVALPVGATRVAKMPQPTPKRSVNLVSLPAEILVLIMQHLNTGDVENLRELAIQLEGPSNERSVWLAILQREAVTRLARPFWPRWPLDQLSARNIEAHLVGWSRSPLFAPRSHLRTYNLRPPATDLSFVQSLGTTPEGRFILKVTLDGAIYQLDPRKRGNSPVLLCSRPESNALVHARSTDIAFDCISGLGSGELFPTTFNAAVLHLTKRGPNTRRRDWDDALIEVWELTRTPQGYSARRLTWFTEPNALDSQPRHITIYEGHVAYALCGIRQTAVIGWVHVPPGAANTLASTFPRFYLVLDGSSILLPGGRIAVVLPDRVTIHQWAKAPQTPRASRRDTEGAKIWQDTLPLASYPPWAVSLRLVGDTVRFVVASSTYVMGVIVPLSNDRFELVPLLQPEPTAMLPWSGLPFSYGYHKAVVYVGEQLFLLTYFWPDDVPFRRPNVIPIPKVPVPGMIPILSFQEVLNEVLVCSSDSVTHPLHKL